MVWNFVLNDIITQAAVPAQEDHSARSEINAATNETFKIVDTKLHVTVLTLSTQDDNKLLKQLNTGFKRTTKWKKYRPEMSNQTKSNNLMKMIEYLFQSIIHQMLN